MANPVQRGTSGGSTPLPVPHGQLVDIDFLNAGALVIARKTTAKTATNTVTETDLLNGEFTLPANLLGTKGMARLTLLGDGLWNSGSTQGEPRFRFKLGASTLLDTGAPGGAMISSSSTRGFWRAVIELMNLGATNSQTAALRGLVSQGNAVSSNISQHVFGTGQGWVGAGGSGTNIHNVSYDGITTSAVDTTSDQLIQFTVVNASSTTTEMQLLAAILEIV